MLFNFIFHFSVLPGSLDRLVQITGTVPNNVAQAKVLMEDTIRRNQSPLPDGDSHSIRASVDQAISGSSRPTSVSGCGHSGTAMTSRYFQLIFMHLHLRFHEIFHKLLIKFYKCFVRLFFLYVANNVFYVRLTSKVLQNLPPKSYKMFVAY